MEARRKENDLSNSDSDQPSTEHKPGPVKRKAGSSAARPMCQYGVKCYRNNPDHFQQFQHPASHSKHQTCNNTEVPTPAEKKSRPDNVSVIQFGDSRPTNGLEAVQCCEPFNFLLTKVADIPNIYNASGAIHIKGLLSTSMGQLQKSAQFNYMIDIPWLVSQYPTEFKTKPLLIVHGFQRAEKTAIDEQASAYEHIRLCQAKLEIIYGTHHTKMMLLQYASGMRVVIHTANLVSYDWLRKTQGVWVSPLFPVLSSSSTTDGDSETHFKRDLIEYLTAYKCRPLEEWIKIISDHDMSSAKVHIIGSCPGRHKDADKSKFGHLKLRKVLREFGPACDAVKTWPVIGQFSSIGSLGSSSEQWLCGEWLHSMASGRGAMQLSPRTISRLQLIFPSVDNVRESLEGYPAGTSLPYSINVAKKQTYLRSFLHEWKSDVRCRSVASPHIKTYTRISPDGKHIAWFILTSANLSKAAWGMSEKSGSQLMIRSYELGVLFLPQSFGTASTFQPMTVENCRKKTDVELAFPLPYDIPLAKYKTSDEPWVYDIAHVDKPDTHGNKWCPS